MSKSKVTIVLTVAVTGALASLGAMSPASAASSSSTPRSAVHSSTVCAQTNSVHGVTQIACPAASVYTKWAHASYHVSASAKTAYAASGKVVAPATNASCEIYVSDLTLQGGNIVGDTVNTCLGNFTYQYIGEQTWRSSWSGWRGYDAWGFTPDETANQINYDWTIGCNGPGTYDYIQAAYGAVDGIAGPTTISLNSKRWACGANA